MKKKSLKHSVVRFMFSGLIVGFALLGCSKESAQLNDQNADSKLKASAVAFTQVTGGTCYTMALKSDGTLWATGANFSGELGTGDLTKRTKFVQVLSNVKSVSCGAHHTLALKNDGTLWVTGDNSNGQLGLSQSITSVNTFTNVQAGLKDISAGAFFSLALKTNGDLWGTGQNDEGELGTGDYNSRFGFTMLLSGVSSISAGNSHSLALKSSTLYATGNYGGSPSNIFVSVLTYVRTMSAGYKSTMAIKTSGSLYVIGSNFYGNLGTGDNIDRNTFTKVISSVVVGVNCGSQGHTTVRLNDGSLMATGWNIAGQLGLGDYNNRNVFTKVVSSGVSRLGNNITSSFYIKTDGTLWATGNNRYGELGLGDNDNDRNVFTQTGL